MFSIRFASVKDVPLILTFIKKLAAFEKLAHEVVATEEVLKETLFGEKSPIEFYKSLGAEPMSDWTVYRVDERTLEKLACHNNA